MDLKTQPLIDQKPDLSIDLSTFNFHKSGNFIVFQLISEKFERLLTINVVQNFKIFVSKGPFFLSDLKNKITMLLL